MTPGPQAIIFDFDGVIANTEPLHFEAFRRVLAGVPIALGKSVYAEKYMGLSDRVMLRTVLADSGRSGAEPQLETLLRHKQAAYLAMIAGGHPLLPGVEHLIRCVTRDRLLAICSGARRVEIDTILAPHGLLTHFPVIVSADDVTTSKPDPAGFLLTLNRLRQARGNLTADACLVIEDSVPGLTAARAAGMRTLAVRPRRGPADPLPADATVPDLTHVDDALLAAVCPTE
ncbi:MAG: HAD family hydrolase [Phycisphaerae bacterium]